MPHLFLTQAPTPPAENGLVDFSTRLFESRGFPARWTCGSWPEYLGWLHIAADVAIFFAYFAIPVSLFLLLARRRDVPMRAIVWLFIAFILSCGCTHLVDAAMFYQPMYRFLGLMKVVTAIVSLATVVALIRIMPTALNVPSILASHGRLKEELQARQIAEEHLIAARDELEARGAQLTVRERRLRAAMAGASAAALRWNGRTNQIDWELGAHDLLTPHRNTPGPLTHWSEVLSQEQLNTLVIAADEAHRTRQAITIDLPLRSRGTTEWKLRLSASPEIVPTDKDPMMTGMFRLYPIGQID